MNDFHRGLVLAFFACAAAFFITWKWPRSFTDAPPAPPETCWKDPHPERSLDFDFYTGIDGKPNRCGYLQTGVLPTVLGDRGLDLVLQCYPLAHTECHVEPR